MAEHDCKICRHPKRLDIEKLIVTGVPARDIASQFGGFSYKTVYRHKPAIAKKIAKAVNKNESKIIEFNKDLQEQEQVEAINLAQDLFGLRNVVMDLLNKFVNIEEEIKQMKDPEEKVAAFISKNDMILKSIDRMVKVLDLYARVHGEIEAEKHLHIHNNPDVLRLIGAIHSALEPYPDAMTAVTEVLQGLGA